MWTTELSQGLIPSSIAPESLGNDFSGSESKERGSERARIFDMKTFKNDMEMIIQTIDTEKLPGYKRLLTEEYWKISDDQFPGIIEEVFEDIKKNKLQLIEIVKLFAYFSYFSKRGLIDYDIKYIKAIFLEAMDEAAEKSEFCDNIDEELSRIGIDERRNFEQANRR